MSQPILIAGGGITGFTLALALTQNGVPVRIIEKDYKPSVFQRGTGIHPRTLEMHNLLGTLTEIMQKSSNIPSMDIYTTGGKELLRTVEMSNKLEPTPDRPYLNMRRLWQSRHMDVLRDHLKARGIEVEYGTVLDSFSQNADEVTVSLFKEGSIETCKVPYLVSTEGAHSVVRKGLGLSFLGETRTEHFCLADVEVLEGENLDKENPQKWSKYGDFKKGIVNFSPCEDPDLPYYGIYITGQDVNIDEISASEGAFVNKFYEITGRSDVKFGRFLGLRKYTPSVRMVDRFQEGRCFVAGDAAHVHSPAGGQGLNSGFQDAMNLGWKLSLVYKNLAPPTLLDSYTDERLPVIAAMLNKTSEIMAKKFDATDRRNVGGAMGGELNMLGINYRGSEILVDELHNSDTGDISDSYTSGIGIRAGDRAPDAPALEGMDGKMTSLFGLYKSYEHTVLIFARNADDALPFDEAAKPGIAKTVLILPSGSSALTLKHGKALVDKEGHAFAAYVEKDAGRNVTVVAVRPDGYVGAMVQSLDGLKEYFTKLFI